MAFNFQKQVDESADLPHVGNLRSAHQQGIGVAGSDFRGEVVRRGACQRLLQEYLALRLTSLRLPAQDVPQKLAGALPRLPILLCNLGVAIIGLSASWDWPHQLAYQIDIATVKYIISIQSKVC